jgi:hypothetical protein
VREHKLPCIPRRVRPCASTSQEFIIYFTAHDMRWDGEMSFAASEDYDGRFSNLDFWDVHLVRAEVNATLSSRFTVALMLSAWREYVKSFGSVS